MSLARFTALPRRSRNALNSLIDRHICDLDPPQRGWPARLSAALFATRTIWQARAPILTFLRTGDEVTAYRLRCRFGLAAEAAPAHAVPADLFRRAAPVGDVPPATVIVPVHNAADEVSRLFARLPGTIPAEQPVIVVDDGSDDPRIAGILEKFVQIHPAARVLDMNGNQGFVAAVNAGLAAADPAHHAVLLNSDTLPPEDWLPRLLAPIADDADVASVTPFSTAAEILSIPRPGIASDLTERLVTDLDAAARRLLPRRIELPTGIGFCIALNRGYLDRLGGFDPAFGRGYGEEVDWCLRTAAAGARHVVATNLVVGHEGHASFGAAGRAARLREASRRIAARHPAFPGAALDWEARDPVAPERLALSLAWTASTAGSPVRVFIAHSLGGGAEQALQAEIAARFGVSSDPVVILRAGGPKLWRVEVRSQRFSVCGDVEDADLLHDLLAPLGKRHVVYSCAVGSADPGAVPETLLRLACGHRLDLRLHDFFVISPSWNLLGGDGSYAGIPDLASADPAHALPAAGTRPGMPHRAWRERWRRVVVEAAEITVFDPSGAALIEKAYPEAGGKTVLRPHSIPSLPGPAGGGGRTIGVLGGINRAKGGAVLEALARHTSRRIAIVGELDGQFRLPRPHVVHGRYDRSEIAALAARYGIGIWFIPSICPETFSFATREALATGRPVVCFGLGAQAEAVKAAPNGHVLPCPPEAPEAVAKALEAVLAGRATAIRRR